MGLLSKDALVAAATSNALPTERVEVPELGEGQYVIVRGMSGAQRDSWERSLVVGRGKRRDVNTENIRARLAVRCLVDDKGERLFTDAEASVVGGLRVDVLQRIFEAAQRLSGVSDDDVDELKKASEMAAGSGSPTN